MLTVLTLASGQIMLKLAAVQMDFSISGILPSLLNLRFISALCIYAAATLMWLAVLKTTPLHIAYPFMAFVFVLVQILAHFILGEELHWNTALGATMIFFGVWVSTLR